MERQQAVEVGKGDGEAVGSGIGTRVVKNSVDVFSKIGDAFTGGVADDRDVDGESGVVGG